MKKSRYIFLICALTAAAWSVPGLAHASKTPPLSGWNKVSAFDGHSAFDGGSAFDGH